MGQGENKKGCHNDSLSFVLSVIANQTFDLLRVRLHLKLSD